MKIITKSFNKFKKPCLWPIFGPFLTYLVQNNFPETPALSLITSCSFLAPFQNDGIPRKCPDRRKNAKMDGRTDRPFLTGPFRLRPGVEKISLIFPLKFSKSKQIYFKYSYINFVVIQSLKKAAPFCDLQ